MTDPGSAHPSWRDVIRPTTIVESDRLSRRLGSRLTLASETFQHTGSFKFRAAYHLAVSIPHPRIITASSGNFGQAIACACQRLDKRCTVVMPDTSAQVKIAAVREFGGVVELIDVRQKSRQERVKELAGDDAAAYVASPYDDPLVIAGNATLGEELAALHRPLQFVLTPVGGGGLAAGLVQGLKQARRQVQVIGVEPHVANDAARSLRTGHIVANAVEPQTIADGVRTVSLGRHNWEILRDGLAGIVEVSEEQIQESLRLLFLYANLKAEPTGALALAGLLARPDMFRNACVCCVVSGGNVDPTTFCRLLDGQA